MRIEYTRGKNGWAGIYWQHPEGNWGEKKGYDLSSDKGITFYARGERGSEIVDFISGGIDAQGKPHRDRFKTSLGKLVLSQDWQQYSIDLSKFPAEDRKEVIGAFAWVGSGGFDSTGKLVCHIADIQVVR